MINKANFSKFLGQKPSLEATLMQSTKRFLMQRYAAMNVPIFGNMSEQLLNSASSLATFAHFKAGDVIYRQGDPPKAFYVVLHGEVTMSTEKFKRDELAPAAAEAKEGEGASNIGAEEKEANRAANMLMTETAERKLTVGQHFGEVGVILPQTPCIATCTATTNCSLLSLESSKFIELFGSDLTLLAEMQIKLLRHGCTLRACLNHDKGRPLFVKHIEGEYSGENIKFFDVVTDLLKRAKQGMSAHNDVQELQGTLKEIIKEYILDGSSQQVNIPSHQQKGIKAMYDSGALEWANPLKGEAVEEMVGKMKDAQTEIYVLMARDNYPRFVKSSAFDELLSEVGSYDASVTELVSENDLTMLVQDGEGSGEDGESNLMNAHLNA